MDRATWRADLARGAPVIAGEGSVGENSALTQEALDHHLKAEEWEPAVTVAQALAARATGKDAARLRLQAGELLLHRVGDARAAIRQFHFAHEADPSDLRSVQGLEYAHRVLDDDAGLIQSYHEVLERLPAHDSQSLVDVYVRLAEVYLTGIGSRDDGAAALEHAVLLDPLDEMRHRVLIELYDREPRQPARQVPHYRALVSSDQFGEESLSWLHRWHLEQDQLEGAWACADTLRFLGRATPEMEKFLGSHDRGGRPSTPMDEQAWRNSRPRGESRLFAFVMATCAPAIAATYSVDLRSHVKKGDRIEVNSSPVAFCRRLAAAHYILGVPLPEVYRWRKGTGLHYVHAGTPVLLLGEGVLSGLSDEVMAYLAAKHLAYMRAEYYPIRVLHRDLPTMRGVFLACLQLAAPTVSLPESDRRAVDALLPRLDPHVPADTRQLINKALVHYRGELPVVRVDGYVRAAERTAARVGLLMSGDLRPAVQAAITGPRLSTLRAEDLIKDLIRFSVSAEMLALRESMGFPPVEPAS